MRISATHVVARQNAATSLMTGTVGELRDVWEETSFAIERLQAAEACVDEEQAGLATRVAPSWHLSFTPTATPPEKLTAADKVFHENTCKPVCMCSWRYPLSQHFALYFCAWRQHTVTFDCRCVWR